MEYDTHRMITVAETEPFQKKANQLLSDGEKSDMMPLYLLTVFGKNEKANISMREKQILSRLVKELVSFWS